MQVERRQLLFFVLCDVDTRPKNTWHQLSTSKTYQALRAYYFASLWLNISHWHLNWRRLANSLGAWGPGLKLSRPSLRDSQSHLGASACVRGRKRCSRYVTFKVSLRMHNSFILVVLANFGPDPFLTSLLTSRMSALELIFWHF